MLRYRNFRTFTAPTRLPFTSVAIDPSAEVVCGASQDSFNIHLWSVQTGQLLDQLSGHEGPVSTLTFTPDGTTLISGSWDKTVRLWSPFARTQSSEPLQLESDLLCVAVRPDSNQLAASTLDGQLAFWDLRTSNQELVLDGRRDVSGGRTANSRRTAASSPGTKSFNTITYSADGSCLLAAGNSKYICLYAISTLTLIKKFAVSTNLSLNGTQEFLNSRQIMANGQAQDDVDTEGDKSDLEDRIDQSLPGARRGKDVTSRVIKPEVRVTCAQFAPTGRSFCAASTEGLLIYSLDDSALADFDPFDLDIDVTPQNIVALLKENEPNLLMALVMAFRLSDKTLISKVFEAIPYVGISLIVRELPRVYLARLLRFLAAQLEGGPHLEFCLLWVREVFSVHGRYIKERQNDFVIELRAVMRGMDSTARTVRRLAERNKFEIDFLSAQTTLPAINAGVKMLKNGVEMENGSHIQTNDDNDDSDGSWVGVD